jgi:serine/threonine protein kinase
MRPEQAERLAELVEHAFELEVALKLVRVGMHPAEIVARFRHEEQILASLNHPNIAQLKTRFSASRASLRSLGQT